MTTPGSDQPNFDKPDPYAGQQGYPPHETQGYPPAGAQGYPQPGPGGYPPAGPPYGQPYGAPGYGPDPSAPWGRHPVTGQPYSDKSKLVAGLLQFFLGCFGVGRFYTGHTGIALGQLFTCGGLGVWALIDAILILVGKVDDPQGRPLRD